MNCKEGDLAYVASPRVTPGLRGRFVIVERRAVPGDIFASVEGRLVRLTSDEPCWVCRPAGGSTLPWAPRKPDMFEFEERPIADAVLRPLRDSDGEDEMLRIVGKPEPHGVVK